MNTDDWILNTHWYITVSLDMDSTGEHGFGFLPVMKNSVSAKPYRRTLNPKPFCSFIYKHCQSQLVCLSGSSAFGSNAGPRLINLRTILSGQVRIIEWWNLRSVCVLMLVICSLRHMTSWLKARVIHFRGPRSDAAPQGSIKKILDLWFWIIDMDRQQW